MLLNHIRYKGGGGCTVVARWNADQQVEESILHHNKIHSISPGCPRPYSAEIIGYMENVYMLDTAR